MSLPIATPCEYVMGAMRLVNNFSELANVSSRVWFTGLVISQSSAGPHVDQAWCLLTRSGLKGHGG